MRRCPLALVRDPTVARLLPHLSRYYQYGIYPNGMGRLYQSMAFLVMCDVFSFYMDTFKEEHLKSKSH